MQLCPFFTSYQQEGFKDGSPGVLVFYDSSHTLLLWLALHKKNGLYYCPIDTIATDTLSVQPQISQSFINNYMDIIDDGLYTDVQVAPTFARESSFSPCLPTISETIVTNPLLDPLVEQPFDDTLPEISNTSAINPDSLEDEKPPQRSRFRLHPVHAATQLEPEL